MADNRRQQHFNIVILGAGPGGYSTALRSSQLGLSVALVERDERLGGVCLNRGCIPSKALITATHAMASAANASRMGINATVESVDFEVLRKFKDRSVASMTDGLQSLIEARKITVFHGTGMLERDRTVRVIGSRNEKHDIRLTGDHIILATGSSPKPLPGVPFSGRLLNSTQALDLLPFPGSAIVIGAGAVAVEFTSMWNEAGVDVTLLIRKDRVLSGWHKRTGTSLTRALKNKGVTVVPRTQVTAVETDEDGNCVTVRYTDRAGAAHKVQADVALGAIGRLPHTTGNWQTDNGIELDDGGQVVTDAYGRTSAPCIWALGDITDGPDLAYRAFEQGIVIAESIAGFDPDPVDDSSVPQVVFSSPEAASVGFTLQQARTSSNIADAKETVYPVMGNARMQMNGESGSLSIVSGTYATDPHATVVLGVHMVAPQASDLIAEAEQIVGNRVPLSHAARLISPHPTLSEMLGEALLKADGRPLNTR